MKKILSLLGAGLISLFAALSSHADPPFRQHRYDTYKVLPIDNKSIVFVGNSITDMHPWIEAWGNDPRVVNRGNSGGLSSEILANVKSYCAGHPAKIFMMVGTNDVTSASAATIASNIEKTIKAIQTESPSTEIYVESMLPSTNNGRTNTMINAANTAIKNMLADYPTVTYIDLYSKLVGKCDNNNSGYSYDALHLTAAGYQIWLAEIEKYMDGLKSVYPTNTKDLQVSTGLPQSSFGMRGTYFSMMPMTSEDVLFFGDEMVKNGEWAELLRNKNVKNRGTNWGYEKTSANMSYTSADIDCAFAQVNGVTKNEPKQVLLYTGTGEVNGTTPVATIVSNYKKVVEKIRKYAPNAKISLVSLMPTYSYNNNRVKDFNSKIQDYAIEQENVEYIDIYSSLATATDGVNTKYFPANDDYVYGDGYVVIAGILNRYIEGCNPITMEEAAANRALIRGEVVALKPAVTLQNLEFDGTAPFKLDDGDAATIKGMKAVTTVIDFTTSQTPVAWASIVGSSSNKDDNYFSLGKLKDGRIGTRYTGLQGLEGWYTRNTDGQIRQQMVFVQDPEDTNVFTLYIKGAQQFAFTEESLGAYGYVTYNTREGQDIYLGGLVTKSSDNYFPFVGTIHSIRFYDKALTAEQVAELSYDLTEQGEEKGPETITYTIDHENGYLQRNDGTIDANWNTYWYSNDTPQLCLSAGVNNMTWDGNNVQIETGSTTSATYTLLAPEGYYIKDVKMTATAKTATSVNLTFDADTYTTKPEGQTFEKTDINKPNFAFGLSGINAVGTILSDYVVTIIRKDLVETDEETLDEPKAFTVFATPTSGGVPYRIPAVATAQNGNIIVVADYRTSRADIGSGEIDLHVRLSKDNGKTWEKIMMPKVMDGDGKLTPGYQFGAFGDPCIVADRESGRVMVMSCSGHPGYFNGSRQQHQGLARWYSYDNGETWEEAPSFIDEEFIYSKLDKSTYGPITGMFVGSGKIHQSRYVKVGEYYRLYCSFSCHKANTTNSTNFVIYSDDFGQTWDFLGGINNPAVPSGGDEPKVEELPNGNVIFSGRVYGAGGRNINIFQFSDIEKAEGKWMGKTVSNASVAGIGSDNACNGEIQLVPVIRKSDGVHCYLALQSVPFGSGRNNVGIYYKPLDTTTWFDTPANFAKKWEGSHQASYTSSCYSTMSVQADKTIAFVYEENSKNYGYDIQYKNYSIEVITGGKYSFDKEYVPELQITAIEPVSVTPAEGTVEQLDVIEITFNQNIKLKTGKVDFGNGITATLKTKTSVPQLLTVTLNEPLTKTGKYTLTFPKGTLRNTDGLENEEFSLNYRIIPSEAQPLGEKVTSLDAVENTKTYALYNPHFTAYATFNPEQSESAVWTAEMIGDTGHSLSNPAYGEKANFADPNTAWMLVNHKDNYYLYNVGADKFVKVGRPTAFVDDAASIKVEEISDGFAFNTSGGYQDYMCAAPQLTEPIAVWTSDDDGSCWQLIENPNVEADLYTCLLKIDPEAAAGIQHITVDNIRKGFYDLQGRQLQGLPERRGLYIVNGRKVVK